MSGTVVDSKVQGVRIFPPAPEGFDAQGATKNSFAGTASPCVPIRAASPA